MGRTRTRTRRSVAGVTALVLVGSLVFGAGAASAEDPSTNQAFGGGVPKVAVAKNSKVTGKCGINFQNVQPDGDVVLRGTSEAHPTYPSGLLTNAATYIECFVYDAYGEQVAGWNMFRNSPIVPLTARSIEVDYSDDYYVCAWAITKLSTGATYDAFGCA